MKRMLLASLMTLGAASAQADPGVMFGVSYAFGGDLGLSVKMLSSDREERWVGAVGGTWYPVSNRIGAELGVGRTFEDGAVTVGWDILNSQPKIGIGYMDTDD